MTKLGNDTTDVTDEEIGGEDWDTAFDEFYEDELKDDKSDDDKSDDDKQDDDDKSDDDKQDDDDKSDDDKQDDDDKSDDDKQDDDDKSDDDKSDDDKQDDKQDEDKDPNAEQRSVVKDALKEVYDEQQQADAELKQTIEEALQMVRPNGIEDPRVDSDGDRLNSPADVEKLYNPSTGELFTPSEAKAWFDQATAKYEQNVQAAQQEATQVAQVARKMDAGREAVMRNYGEFIDANPEIAKKVLMSYMATVKVAGEGKNQYIADAPLDLLAFYNDHMYPYVELAEKQKEADEAAEAAKKAKEDAIKRGKAERDESRDLPTNVSDDATKTGDAMEWDDAFKSYYGSK